MKKKILFFRFKIKLSYNLFKFFMIIVIRDAIEMGLYNDKFELEIEFKFEVWNSNDLSFF